MKKSLLLLILFILLIPGIVRVFNLYKEKPLEGIKNRANKPTITYKNYLNGTYQDSLNIFLDENYGFRSALIRRYNQINFDVFSKTSAPGVVVGKNNMLFIESYINNYVGNNFVGNQKVDLISSKTKALQDSLKKKGTDLIIIFAPGKATYYSEFIPDYYWHNGNIQNNYKAYKSSFLRNGVNFLDLNSWFLNLKPKTPYVLYPKYGTHWTSYGIALAADTIIKRIESLKKVKMTKFDYSKISLSSKLNESDYDIGILLNIQKKLPDTVPYPEFNYFTDKSTYKPSVLAIGDSYWWNLVGSGIPSKIFLQDEYWFYNKDIYINNSKQSYSANDRNLKIEISKHDVIILMATEATLDLFPYGFIEKAYSMFCTTSEQRIDEIFKSIDNDNNWLNSIKEKAKKNNIEIEKQKRLDAIYIFNEENRVYTEWMLKVEQTKTRIRNTPEWMNSIEQKAIEKNISIEKQIYLDALYIMNQENPN